MLRFASASAALAVALTALAGGASGRSDGAVAACPNSSPPTVLPEPASTRGDTNVIRWERVPTECWDGEGADGKKSTHRQFIVRISGPNGTSSSTSVSGADAVQATIDADDLRVPAGASPNGRRYQYVVLRSEFVCTSGNSTLGICNGGTRRVRDPSAPVASTQDTMAPTASLQLAGGAVYTASLDVAAAVTASDPGGRPAWVQLSGRDGLACPSRGHCVEPYGQPLTVRLEGGADGERTVQARVWDDAREPAGSPGAVVFGLPPGHSVVASDSIVLDRTGPAYVLGATTTRATVGVPVRFEARSPGDAGAGIDAAAAAWRFGDGAVATGLSAVHAYAAPGTYRASFTLADRVGNATTTELELVVVTAPVPPVPASVPATPPAPAAADRAAPVLTALAVRRVRARRTLAFRVSERGRLLVEVVRLRPRPQRRLATSSRAVRAGRGSVVLPAALARPGRYRVTVAARDAAGNVSRPRTLVVVTPARR